MFLGEGTVCLWQYNVSLIATDHFVATIVSRKSGPHCKLSIAWGSNVGGGRLDSHRRQIIDYSDSKYEKSSLKIADPNWRPLQLTNSISGSIPKLVHDINLLLGSSSKISSTNWLKS